MTIKTDMLNVIRALEVDEVRHVIKLGKAKPEKKVKEPKRKKLSERKKLIKQLDQVVREIVMKNGKYCVTCGKTTQLQCGHLITRSRYGTRWDLLNCHIQCSGCNYRHEFQPEIYTLWFIRQYGSRTYQELCNRAESQGKFTIDELESMLIVLTETLKG